MFLAERGFTLVTLRDGAQRQGAGPAPPEPRGTGSRAFLRELSCSRPVVAEAGL